MLNANRQFSTLSMSSSTTRCIPCASASSLAPYSAVSSCTSHVTRQTRHPRQTRMRHTCHLPHTCHMPLTTCPPLLLLWSYNSILYPVGSSARVKTVFTTISTFEGDYIIQPIRNVKSASVAHIHVTRTSQVMHTSHTKLTYATHQHYRNQQNRYHPITNTIYSTSHGTYHPCALRASLGLRQLFQALLVPLEKRVLVEHVPPC